MYQFYFFLLKIEVENTNYRNKLKAELSKKQRN